MKLILHHLIKDIRAQRWLLLLGALALLTQIMLNALLLQPDYDLARRIGAIRTSPFFFLISFLVWTVLLARLIQSDPVTGSTSFWLTRPIAPRVYLSSKLLFFLGLMILPSLLPALLYAVEFHSTAEMLGDDLVSCVVLQLVAGLCVGWLATYTPSLLHFAGMLCLILLGSVLFSLLAFSLQVHPHANLVGQNQVASPHGGILVIGLFVSLVVQYRLRRTRIGLILGIAALVLELVSPFFLPNVPVPAASPYALTGKSVQVEFSPDWQKTISWGHGSSTEAMARLAPISAAPGTQTIIEGITSTFQLPDGKSMELPSGIPFSSMFPFQAKPLELLRESLTGSSVLWPGHDHDFLMPVPLFSLDLNLKQQLQGKMGTLVLKITRQTMTLEQTTKIPLAQPGFIGRFPGGFIRVCPPDPKENKENKELTVWKIALKKNINEDSRNTIYVLVDSQNHTGTVLNQGGSSFSSGSSNGGFQLVDSEISLNLNGTESLDRMVLYIFEFTSSADFATTLTVPDFTMNPTP
jgi:hypothetical protein